MEKVLSANMSEQMELQPRFMVIFLVAVCALIRIEG